MREEEVAAERHGSGAGAGSNAVGDLVDLLGGDSFVVEDPPRPGKDKKGVEGHAGGRRGPVRRVSLRRERRGRRRGRRREAS
jgi:hypothetical protein